MPKILKRAPKPKSRSRWILRTSVFKVEEKFTDTPSGVGLSMSKQKSLGWWVQLTGSSESFFISETDPGLKPGDEVEITLQTSPK